MILWLLTWNASLWIIVCTLCSYSSRFHLKSTFTEHLSFWGSLSSLKPSDFSALSFDLHQYWTSSTALRAAGRQELYWSHLCNSVTKTELAFNVFALTKTKYEYGPHLLTCHHFVVAVWNHVFFLKINCCLFFFLRFYLSIFRKRGKEGEREGEKHWSVVSHTPPSRDMAPNPGMYPNQELNRWPPGLQAGTQSTGLHQPGLKPCLKKTSEARTPWMLWRFADVCHGHRRGTWNISLLSPAYGPPFTIKYHKTFHKITAIYTVL